MIGAIPALLTYYRRMKMPDTGRYTAIMEGKAKQAAADMARVLELKSKQNKKNWPNSNQQMITNCFMTSFLGDMAVLWLIK